MNIRAAGAFGLAFISAYVAAFSLTGDMVVAARGIGYIGGFATTIGLAVYGFQEWDQ